MIRVAISLFKRVRGVYVVDADLKFIFVQIHVVFNGLSEKIFKVVLEKCEICVKLDSPGNLCVISKATDF